MASISQFVHQMQQLCTHSGLVLLFYSKTNHICICWRFIWGHTHTKSLQYSTVVSLHIFLAWQFENSVTFLLYSWCLSQNQLSVNIEFYFWVFIFVYSLTSVCKSAFMPAPHCLGSYRFVVYFYILCVSSSFALFYQTELLWRSFVIPNKF